jgi:hypothetical protein
MKSLVLVLILFASPLFAQNHEGIVQSVKAQLVATGANLAGPCGAFEITKRVAWILRGEGAGLLHKNPGQNQCAGVGVDVVIYQDGRLFDILTDSGGANGPVWHQIESVSPSLWRPPVDPGTGGNQPIPPPNVPIPPVVVPQPIPSLDLSGVYQRFDLAYAQQERMFDLERAERAELLALLRVVDERLKTHDEEKGGDPIETLIKSRTFWELLAVGIGGLVIAK